MNTTVSRAVGYAGSATLGHPSDDLRVLAVVDYTGEYLAVQSPQLIGNFQSEPPPAFHRFPYGPAIPIKEFTQPRFEHQRRLIPPTYRLPVGILASITGYRLPTPAISFRQRRTSQRILRLTT